MPTAVALEEDDANDILYRSEASFDYDPAGELGAIRAPVQGALWDDHLASFLASLPGGS